MYCKTTPVLKILYISLPLRPYSGPCTALSGLAAHQDSSGLVSSKLLNLRVARILLAFSIGNIKGVFEPELIEAYANPGYMNTVCLIGSQVPQCRKIQEIHLQ